MQAQMFGFPAPEVFTPNRWLEDGGDTVTVGNETLEVLHTPGHTPLAMWCFSIEAQNWPRWVTCCSMVPLAARISRKAITTP